MADAEIVALVPADAPQLARLLGQQRAEYLAHFHPFAFDEETIAKALANARNDRFWGVRVDGAWAGFFMLRGFDEGYARPSFGVFIAEDKSGQGLARLALQYALDWCAREGVERVMLKVAPENERARRTYVCAGFRRVERCAASGQEILELSLNERQT